MATPSCALLVGAEMSGGAQRAEQRVARGVSEGTKTGGYGNDEMLHMGAVRASHWREVITYADRGTKSGLRTVWGLFFLAPATKFDVGQGATTGARRVGTS